jgi:membrane-bound metal-dependent hydrolase YbcI (DUF457 family)
MNGGQHFIIGAASAGVGLWAARSLGLEVGTGTILVSAAVAGIGSLAPDIDHPRSTISRGLPAELLWRGLALLALPLLLVILPLLSGDFQRALATLQSLSQTAWMRWGLALTVPAIGLLVVSTLISALFGHRGATHSLVFGLAATLIAMGVCLYLDAAWWYGLLFGWGWLLHLLADTTTGMGLPALWWPLAGEDRPG